MADSLCTSVLRGRTEVGCMHVSRTWSTFNTAAFEQELADSELFSMQSDDVDWLLSEYSTHLTKLLDKHAPKRDVCRKTRRLALWFDGECHAAKKSTRRLEQLYRRSRQPQCRDSWQQAIADYRTLLYARRNSSIGIVASLMLPTTHAVCGIR